MRNNGFEFEECNMVVMVLLVVVLSFVFQNVEICFVKKCYCSTSIS